MTWGDSWNHCLLPLTRCWLPPSLFYNLACFSTPPFSFSVYSENIKQTEDWSLSGAILASVEWKHFLPSLSLLLKSLCQKESLSSHMHNPWVVSRHCSSEREWGSLPPGNTGLCEMEPYVKKWAFFSSSVCLLCCFCSWPLLQTPVPQWMLLFFFSFSWWRVLCQCPPSRSPCCASKKGASTPFHLMKMDFLHPFFVCILQVTSLSMVSHQCSFTLVILCNCVFFFFVIRKHKDIQVTFSVYNLIIFINVC